MVNIAVSAMLIALVAFITVWKMRFAKAGAFFEDYFSVKQTGSIKGICAVFILLSHLYHTFGEDFAVLELCRHSGAIMVGGFFFVSGYGLQYSVQNKENYIKGFFLKRFLPFAVTYYTVNFLYIYASKMNTNDILKSLVGYNGNLWFVLTMGLFYIGFWLCNSLLKKRTAAVAVTVYIAAYILVMYKLGFGEWWYNSAMAFAAGIWICVFKKEFTAFFKKGYIAKSALLIAVCAYFYAVYCNSMGTGGLKSLIAGFASATLFPIMLMALSMKIQAGNRALSLCGKLSFEIYLTQALLIHWLKNGFWYDVTERVFDNQLVYLIGVIAGTFIFSMIIHTLCADMTQILREKCTRVLKK